MSSTRLRSKSIVLARTSYQVRYEQVCFDAFAADLDRMSDRQPDRRGPDAQDARHGGLELGCEVVSWFLLSPPPSIIADWSVRPQGTLLDRQLRDYIPLGVVPAARVEVQDLRRGESSTPSPMARRILNTTRLLLARGPLQQPRPCLEVLEDQGRP